MNRRDFLKQGLFWALFSGLNAVEGIFSPAIAKTYYREAQFYYQLPGKKVKCTLCPCGPEIRGVLKENQTCVCSVRTNIGGKLYISNYAQACILHLDPLEKNPLYHVRPGTMSLALATAGCNMACQCCQNWNVSQVGVEKTDSFSLPPEKAVKRALENRCGAVSYSYTEPVIFYEYMWDIAKLAREKGLLNCMLTGGYVYPEPLKKLASLIDAFSVSVKGFSETFYRQYCRGSYKILLNALSAIRNAGGWLELSVLMIPTLSDDLNQVKQFCRWVKAELGDYTPVHFLRFVPEYKLKLLPRAPVSLLESARELAMESGLKFVYLDNLPGHYAANTFCPSCKKPVVERVGFKIISNRIKNGKCSYCGARIPGRWR